MQSRNATRRNVFLRLRICALRATLVVSVQWEHRWSRVLMYFQNIIHLRKVQREQEPHQMKKTKNKKKSALGVDQTNGPKDLSGVNIP